MNMYRDRVKVNNRIIRANVYVMSTQQRMERSEGLREAVLVVTVPPSQRRYVPDDLTEFYWQGRQFYVEGLVIPIMALGRVDHYEFTGVGRRVA